MQQIYETVSESSAHPYSDAELDRTSDLELIKDYTYDEIDYKDSLDNVSITDLKEQLKQLEEEKRSLSRTLDKTKDNLEARMGDNNMIRKQ